LLKKSLSSVSGSADANSVFLTQARNSLPDLVTNLDKLMAHYHENMPRINKVLLSSKLRLTKLKGQPRVAYGTDGLSRADHRTGSRANSGFQLCLDDEPSDHESQLLALRTDFDNTVADLRVEISQRVPGAPSQSARPDLDTVVDEFS
jgi:hypothetical protein